MRRLFSCLGAEQPVAARSPAAQPPPSTEPTSDDEKHISIAPVERQWQALYNGFYTVRGTWNERLGQVMGLAAACCGTAFVSTHLFCPYQSCFVVMASGGPASELLQPGDLQPADTWAEPASLHTGRLAAGSGFLSSSLGGGGGGGGSVSVLEPTSLQLLLRSAVTVHRFVAPAAASGAGVLAAVAAEPPPRAAAIIDAAPLPPDWRRLHRNAHLSEFVAVPILDTDGSVMAALTVAGPASVAVEGGGGAAAAAAAAGSSSACPPPPPPRLAAHLSQLERFARVMGLAFLSDSKQLPVYQLAASSLAAVQRAETLQALVEAAHEGFGALLERHLRLEGARCVLALADAMEARVAYFGPPPPPPPPATGASAGFAGASSGAAGSAAGNATTPAASAVPGPGGGSVSRSYPTMVMSGSSRSGGSARFSHYAGVGGGTGSGTGGGAGSGPLQGVLGPLMDTLLLDVVSREGAPGGGRVISNCRAYLQQEDKPGRDVQVCFHLCRMPPACLALAVVGATESTLAPELALYVCTAQQQLPSGLLEEVRGEVQCVLQLLMPHIHRQLLGPLSAEWASMRLQAAAGMPSALSLGGGAGGGAQSGDGGGASASANSILAGLSGGLSLGGLCRTVSFSVDDVVSHSPAHLKVVVAGIQSTITAAQMYQAWQAAGDSGTRESIDDLYSIRLRETVGQGGQGVVFRGLMHGLEVAVKVVAKDMPGALIARVQQQQQQAAAASSKKGGGGGGGGGGSKAVDPEQVLRTAKRELIRDALELAVTSAVNHPHIVQVHNYFFDVLVVGYAQDDGSSMSRPQPDGSSAAATAAAVAGSAYGSSGTASNYLRLVRRVDATEEMVAEGPTNLVIVMEYCDGGTLKDVLRRGYFRRGMDANGWPRLDFTSMYTCLLEVALALRHMHALALVHCDLKPSNVLLRSQPRDPRGWTCKLSDFGCVRMLKPPAEDGGGSGPAFPHFTVTRALGTLTHMAPEVISKGALLTASVDVYSFGILMAELATGVPQDQCMPGKEAIQLARKGVRPTLPPYCPKEYRDVATACWSHEPHARPTAAELVNVLEMLLNQVQGGQYSANGLGHMLPQVMIHQQPHAAAPGPFPTPPAAAAAPAAPGHRIGAAAANAGGGKTLAAAAAMVAAAMQQASGGAAAAIAGSANAVAAAAALGGTNIAVAPVPQVPPLPGAAAVPSADLAVAAAAAAAARAFPGATPAQILATAAERLLVGGGGAAAADARLPMPGGDPARLSPGQRMPASTLAASMQHNLMLQQFQEQMQLQQQQQLVQPYHHQHQNHHQQQPHNNPALPTSAFQAQAAQAVQVHAAQAQAVHHHHQQLLRQALQHRALMHREGLELQLPVEQLQLPVEQLQLPVEQLQLPVAAAATAAAEAAAVQPLQNQASVPEPQTPQQSQHQQLEQQQQLPTPDVQAQQQQHEEGLLQHRSAAGGGGAAAATAPLALGSSTSSAGAGGAAGGGGTPKPSSFASAASGFSALSPTASSLSSSARQLPAQLAGGAGGGSQQLPGARDSNPANGGSAAAAAAAAPVVLPGSPIAVATATTDQNSSPYESPAEHHLSGATCSDGAVGAAIRSLAANAAAGGGGGGGAAASLDADLFYNTAASTPLREGLDGA